MTTSSVRKRFPSHTDAYRAVNDAFSAARSFRESHEAIDARIAEIREELSSKTPTGRWRYPAYERNVVSGYIAARYDDIWQHVEFCYRDASGTLFSVHRNSTHRKTEEFYAANRGHELPQLEGAHVWKGTDRNYTPWSRHDSEPHKVSAK